MKEIIYTLSVVTAALLLSGCQTPMTRQELLRYRSSSVVSRSELTQKGKLWYLENKVFTGRALVYNGAFFEMDLIDKGRRFSKTQTNHFFLAPELDPDRKAYHDKYLLAFRNRTKPWHASHGTYGTMASYGTFEDIPALIDALEAFGSVDPKEAICSWHHCLDALKYLSKANPGTTAKEWRNWWRQENAKRKR